MNDIPITCPKCGAEVPLSEAVSHRIREQLARDFDQKRREITDVDHVSAHGSSGNNRLGGDFHHPRCQTVASSEHSKATSVEHGRPTTTVLASESPVGMHEPAREFSGASQRRLESLTRALLGH